MKYSVLLLAFFSTIAFADLESETAFDLGILISPSMAPELDYDQVAFRFGIEAGVSFFKYNDSSWVKVKEVTNPPKTTFKLLRVGLSSIVNKPVLFFSPISVLLKDKVYLSPSFGFGEKPYTIFSISYELLP